MIANDRQVGGNYYKTLYEYWDLVAKIPMDYFAGNAGRYIIRWRKKGGIQDLEKAAHYVEKLMEITKLNEPRFLTISEIAEEVECFAAANNLGEQERRCILNLCTYRSFTELNLVQNTLDTMLIKARLQPTKEEITTPGSPEDGGHHATDD